MVRNLLLILGFTVIVFIILLLIEEWIYPSLSNNAYKKPIIFWILVVFALALIAIKNRITKEDERNELRSELGYLMLNVWTPLLWGSGFSLIIVAFSSLFYDKEKNFFEDNIFEITSIFVSSISAIFIIRGIFRKMAPIQSVEKLLERVAEDLEERRFRKVNRIWIVFPALNIGYYREKVDAVPTRNYSDYVTAVSGIKDNPLAKLNVITYPIRSYGNLYKVYAEMNGRAGNDPIVDDCKKEAEARINEVTNSKHKNSYAYTVSPENFPLHCIIIDEIVYLIHTFGLPVPKTDGSGDFESPVSSQSQDKQNKLAKVFIYRQEDKILADMLDEKLNGLQHKIGL